MTAEKGTENINGWFTVFASWLAVFCLFGYRATFAVLKGPMAVSLGWSASEVTLGYSVMMVIYAFSAYFSGMILDKWGARLVYAIAAVFGSLGFLLTARIDHHLTYLFSFGFLGGVATGMLWVTSTVSVRKWYDGKTYGTFWGIAFSGAPIAQFLLAQVIKPSMSHAQSELDRAVVALIPGAEALKPAELALLVAQKLNDQATLLLPEVHRAITRLDSAWRAQMTILGMIVLAALILAVLLARKSPGSYGISLPGDFFDQAPKETEWKLKEAFSHYAIWAPILVFVTSVTAEFLVWTQVVSYWTQDVGYSLKKAAGIYGLIGLIGIFAMPLMGKTADLIVSHAGYEPRGRRVMLIAGPTSGAVACVLLLASKAGDWLAVAACFLFAVYWAIVPGGVVGYTGAIYGRKTLGKIWGLATLIVMGTGPFLGSYAGAWMRDHSGSYTGSICFALGAFILSATFATTLPMHLKPGSHHHSSA